MKTTPEFKAYRRTVTARRNAELDAKARAAGWAGLSEYLTAVRADSASIPPKLVAKGTRKAATK